jgi:hypothetical protein
VTSIRSNTTLFRSFAIALAIWVGGAAISLTDQRAAAQHIVRESCASGCCTTPVDGALAPYDQFPDGQEPPAQGMAAPQLAPEQFASLGGDTISIAQSNVGYIDSAIIANQLRVRFDAAYNMNRPDRAEYYYTTLEAFGGQLPNAIGVPDPDIDFQLISTYLEYALTDRFSVFAEVPVMFSNPSLNPNTAGLTDMQAGFKWGLSNCCDRQLTFQLNNYIPTGDTDRWLSSGHYSIEPGLLYWQRWSDRVTLEAELKDWISVGGSVNPQNDEPFAGNVLQYGIGLGYDWQRCGCWTITPVVEFVGWTVLEGQVTEFDAAGNVLGPVDATGDTIVNVKVGARITECCGGGFYAGYGRSLTGDRWYEDIIRVEYRWAF